MSYSTLDKGVCIVARCFLWLLAPMPGLATLKSLSVRPRARRLSDAPIPARLPGYVPDSSKICLLPPMVLGIRTLPLVAMLAEKQLLDPCM